MLFSWFSASTELETSYQSEKANSTKDSPMLNLIEINSLCTDFPLAECLQEFAETAAVSGVTPEGNGTAFTKIFIFGDSYVDNGNLDPKNNTETLVGSVNKPWKTPYGQSNPGGPAGRFSDGNKVLSDYLCTCLFLCL